MQVSWVRLLMYCSNRLLAVCVSQPISITIHQKVSMEIKGNGSSTAWEIFNYFQYFVIVSSAQVMFGYVNLLHLWKSSKTWDPVLQKAREDEELFTHKFLKILSGKIRPCAGGAFNLGLSMWYTPGIWDQRLQKTDVRMINNTKVTLMRVSSASMQLGFYAHGCPKKRGSN